MPTQMKIVLAPNTFKESLPAQEVCRAMREGVIRAGFEGEIVLVPLADGGDGTIDALVAATHGDIRSVRVPDPLGRPVKARYGVLGSGDTAVIEMAEASGLWRIKQQDRNPLQTSTKGTGELIRAALNEGIRDFIIGIGGSATVDGGSGMAEALGYRFLDNASNPVKPNGGNLRKISKIDVAGVRRELRETRFRVACDVSNPLLGPEGAAEVFGPQKGATAEMTNLLEKGLENLSHLWEHDLGYRVASLPGAGAAGGLGAGLVAFCGAELAPGFDLVAESARLDDALEGADLVLTGEGKVDASTVFGKVPSGVARRAGAKSIPVVCLAGEVAGDRSGLHRTGVTLVSSIVSGPMDLESSMSNTPALVTQASEQIIRFWLAVRRDQGDANS